MNNHNQDNASVVRRLFDEVYNQGNLEIINQLVADDIQLMDTAMPRVTAGVESYKETESIYKEAFPNKRLKVDDLFAAVDKVVVRWTCQATHQGDLQGILPTNKMIRISGISIYQLSDGKITHIWQSWDRLGLLEQIGEIQPALALH